MPSANSDGRPLPYARITAAALCAILLFVAIVLAGLPAFTRAAFPGPLGREDAVLIFFVSVPLVFSAFAVYRVAQYKGLVGSRPQD